MRYNKKIIILFIVHLITLPLSSQLNTHPFRVMFWNVENLFDIQHDTLKNDYEFLPQSIRHWNYTKYKKKINNIARVIAAVGQNAPPSLVGLCEVENEYTLETLTRFSPLKEMGYRYIITQSPDERGIDIALMYQRDQFKLLSHRDIVIPLNKHLHKPTRNILHASGLLHTRDTLDIFVVHTPSRSGGQKESEAARIYVTTILKTQIDSIINQRFHPQIIVMGDFNDNPNNASIKKSLGVHPISLSIDPQKLYHLFMNQTRKSNNRGSYKYKAHWYLFDQMMVSGNLLNTSNRFFTEATQAKLANFDFLLTEDLKYGGKQPYRTYHGMKYQGGFSDHLPIYTDFHFKY